MAKTIEDFRAEYGVRLNTLSEVTGIPAEDLTSSEKLLPVPSQTAQIIIEKYNLPPYYFTGEPSAVSAEGKIPNTLDKFVVPSFVWMLLTSVIITFPAFIIKMIITVTSVISSAAYINVSPTFTESVNKAISLFNIFWTVAVIIVSCNIFAKWLEKKYGFSADKRKFKYLYWIIPSGMTGTVSYVLNNIFYNETILSAKMALTLLCSLIGEICAVVFLALMLKAVSSYEEKDRKLLKFFYIFCGANMVLHAALSVLFDIIHNTFPANCVSSVIYALIMAALVLGLVKDEKAIFSKKACYTVLPLAYLIVPKAISLIEKLYFLITLS